jgi:Family of unknown function (DUF5317)
MFVLYAIPAGLIAGWLGGGRLSAIGRLQIRLAWLAILGYVAQSLLFAPSISRLAGPAVPLLYTATNALVLAVLLANARIRGMLVVALGAFCNLAAIALNGGYMPADRGAYAANGMRTEVYLNTRFLDHAFLPYLGDWIALPRWLPGTNVISVGDLLIGLGIALVIAAAMRNARLRPQSTAPGDGRQWPSGQLRPSPSGPLDAAVLCAQAPKPDPRSTSRPSTP